VNCAKHKKLNYPGRAAVTFQWTINRITTFYEMWQPQGHKMSTDDANRTTKGTNLDIF